MPVYIYNVVFSIYRHYLVYLCIRQLHRLVPWVHNPQTGNHCLKLCDNNTSLIVDNILRASNVLFSLSF